MRAVAADADLVLNVRGGARLSVPADLTLITPYVLAEQEDWFEDEIRFVRAWLRPGMVAADVGASYGAYTLAIARAVGAQGRVWAFEPSPLVAQHLERSLGLNDCGHVRLHRQAASDAAGPVGFQLARDSELGAVAPGAPGALQVDAVRLDDAIGGAELDFLKLDVEGHELSALRGAAKLLSRASPLVMFEVRAGNLSDFRALGPLGQMGYAFYRLAPGPLALLPFDPDEPGEPSQLNLFACKASRARTLAQAGWLVTEPMGELPAAGLDAWQRFAAAAPYATGLAPGWPSRAGAFPGPGAEAYALGLAAFAHAREQMRPLSERIGWLNHALHCVTESLQEADSLPRRLSQARLCWELGWTTDACQVLEPVLARVDAEGASVAAEPFLSPSPRYEAMRGAERVAWVKCAVHEQYERLVNFSSMFDAPATLANVEAIAGLGLPSQEMLRRRQLARWRSGLAAELASLPELCRASDENLNPGFWSALPPE